MCTIVCWLVVETGWMGTPGDNLSRQWTDKDFSSEKKIKRETFLISRIVEQFLKKRTTKLYFPLPVARSESWQK